MCHILHSWGSEVQSIEEPRGRRIPSSGGGGGGGGGVRAGV